MGEQEGPQNIAIDTCSAEKNFVNVSLLKNSEAQEACTRFKVAERAEDSAVLDADSSCVQAEIARQELAAAKRHYQECLERPAGASAFLSLRLLRSSVKTMAQKYVKGDAPDVN